MTFQDWQDKYLKKTGVEFEEELGFITYFLPNRGFCQFAIDSPSQSLVINHMCGDGMFWIDFGAILAHQNGMNLIRTLFCRNPKIQFRSLGWTLDRTETLPDGRINYYGTTLHGKKVSFEYGWTHDTTGKDLYIMNLEV